MRPGNRLLARLPDDEYAQLRPWLKHVGLEARQVLHRQSEPVRFVYFPNAGVVSMATLLADGRMLETATIGNDGLVGVEAFFLDHPLSACETLVQVPTTGDTAECISIGDFRRELATLVRFREAVAQYVETLYAIMARLMACNAHHSVNERCARWLLTVDDRMDGQDFHLSHEFLATMLGVRRQTVTVVAGTLRMAGLIDYVHGHVKILDRAGLEASACECYPAIRSLSSRMKS